MMILGNKLCGHILWKLENKSNSDLSDKMQIALSEMDENIDTEPENIDWSIWY